jgi:hypothetical protein
MSLLSKASTLTRVTNECYGVVPRLFREEFDCRSRRAATADIDLHVVVCATASKVKIGEFCRQHPLRLVQIETIARIFS